jgi:hypothetical protein
MGRDLFGGIGLIEQVDSRMQMVQRCAEGLNARCGWIVHADPPKLDSFW